MLWYPLQGWKNEDQVIGYVLGSEIERSRLYFLPFFSQLLKTIPLHSFVATAIVALLVIMPNKKGTLSVIA
mgnify:CR=1 FL=1